MRRRDVVAFLAGSSAWPRVVVAQPADRVRRIGVLVEYAQDDPEAQSRLTAFRAGLHTLGWVEGRNVRIEYRFAAGDPSRIQAFAAELAGLAPDVILGSGAPVTAALQAATGTVAIVFVQISDPVGARVVPSLGRPGSNVTGFTNFEYAIVGKWLEVLKQIAPALIRVLMVQSPANFGWPGYLRAMETAAPLFGVQFIPGAVHNAADIERVISAFSRDPNSGMIVLPDTTTGVNRKLIVALAERHRLPAVYPFRSFVSAGGLMCYGIDVPDVFRRAASYVDRVLRGEKPGDLPVQAPTRLELVINLKTAAALGLVIPLVLLTRADEVIE